MNKYRLTKAEEEKVAEAETTKSYKVEKATNTAENERESETIFIKNNRRG